MKQRSFEDFIGTSFVLIDADLLLIWMNNFQLCFRFHLASCPVLPAVLITSRGEIINGKAPVLDRVYNEILKKPIVHRFFHSFGTGLYLKLGYIPYVLKIAVLCMLIKPDKPPSQTTSYQPISLLSTIMKFSQQVIKNVFPEHLPNTSETLVSLEVSVKLQEIQINK